MKEEEIIEIFDRFPDAEERSRYLRAKRRVNQLKGFYFHLLLYIIIASVHFIKTYVEKNEIKMEDALGIILWGVVVIIHAASVYLPTLFLGKDWEEKKIQEFTKQYKKEQ